MSRKSVLLVTLLAACSNAYALTECRGVVQSYFTDTSTAASSGAKVWVVMPNGLQWYVLQTDTDSANIVVGITTSIATGMPIAVRFQADNVACDSTSGVRTDVLGMWLVNQ
jgi:hypothetical protein